MASAAVLLVVVALAVTPPALVAAADTTHLHMFLHDVVTGSNPTAVQIIKGPGGGGGAIPGMSFGDTSVVDDALTETSSPTSAAVGRAQGLYMVSSQSSPVLMVCVNLVFTSGAYNGSTIAVIGSDDIMAKQRELSVVGGTGAFRMASGYVLWKTSSMSGPDAVVELDVYVATGNGTATIDASAPVSPADGGSGKGSGSPGSGSSSSSSSIRAAAVYGWVNACVVAVVVAVVGGCVW